MRRATFSVLFYANKSKVKDGIVPVMGRITINGTQSQFSCKRSIPLSLWDAKGNCAKGRTREALDLNRDLDNIKAQIIKHYQHLSDREAFVTAEMVRNAYQGFGSEYETLLGAFDKDIASLKRRVGKDRALGTYKLQVRSRNNVADFLQMNFRRNDISMQVIDEVASLVEELTPDFIKEFAVYLSNERGLASAIIWLTCMHLKGVVGRAHDNGKIQRNVFAQFHISPKCKERTFLTEEELKKVMAHEFEDASLAFVRDLFVFMNFTALSFVDLKELTTDNIVEVNGEKWIVGKRHKTGVPYQVKLLAVPLQIIEHMQRLKDSHARELNRANEQHQQEVSNLKLLLNKAYRWFPSFKRFLNMERECLQYGFNMEQTDKLLYGQRINYSGWLHSNEYRRNALANNVTAQVIRDEKRNLFLHINETHIAQWFKEQFGLGQVQRRDIRV